MDLTIEQVQQAESMSLDELRALAIKEAEEVTAPPVVVPKDKPRDAQGKFARKEDELDNSADPIVDDEPVTTKIYRKEIDNGNGSIDVYEAESLEELVDKIAEGKRNANKKIQEFIAERKQNVTKTEQQTKDENYVVEQNLKTKPAETIKELARQALAEQQEALRRSNEAQERFVATHNDFIANPDNGNRMVSEMQRLGYNEISTEGLEKAYQSLKTSGLLALKAEEANDVTAVEPIATQRTVEPVAEATQQRSPKKGSTISTRTSSRAIVPTSQGPTLDELYDSKKYTTEQVREIAEKAMAAEANRE